MAQAVAYLHSLNIVHGDIKGDNILVSDCIDALLCDFGLAKVESTDTSVALQGSGSSRWRSLELLRDDSAKTFASDIWAFGMTMAEVSYHNMILTS